VLRAARRVEADELSAMINHTADRAHAAAQLAANLALVSIAEDLHRVVAVMTGEAAELLDAKWTREAQERSGAVDDARATREHMQRWAEGGDDHKGEGTL
jgi:hypothetical protein